MTRFAIVLLLLAGCAETPTQAVVTVDNELAEETDWVTVDIRDAADKVSSEHREFAADSWRGTSSFSFGVRAGHDEEFVVSATAYADGKPIAQAKKRFRFVQAQQTRELLHLRRECGFECEQNRTCDPREGMCGPIPGPGEEAKGPPVARTSADAAAPDERSEDRDDGPTRTTRNAAISDAAVSDAMRELDASTPGVRDAAPEAGRPSAGSGAVKDSSSAGPLEGRLIDFRRQPVANVEVHVGDEVGRTDAQGRFTIDAAPGTYDARLTIPASSGGGAYQQAQLWVFYGLRRRDPTLQIFLNPTTSHQVNVMFGPMAPSADQYLQVAFGSTEASQQWYQPQGMTNLAALQWWGPAQIMGTFHALQARYNSVTTEVEYLGGGQQKATVGSSPVNLVFDIARPVGAPAFRVAGQVQAPLVRARQNQLWLRWEDGASLFVAKHDEPGNALGFNVPIIEGARAAVLAIEGRKENDNFASPYGVAVVDDLTADIRDLELSIPTPPALMEPADGVSAVTRDTSFEWSATGGVNLFELTSATQWVFLVTADTRLQLPDVAFTEFQLARGSDFQWSVGTYLKWSTTDAATADGFLESIYFLDVQGPAHGAGPMAWSELRTLTTAP